MKSDRPLTVTAMRPMVFGVGVLSTFLILYAILSGCGSSRPTMPIPTDTSTAVPSPTPTTVPTKTSTTAPTNTSTTAPTETSTIAPTETSTATSTFTSTPRPVATATRVSIRPSSTSRVPTPTMTAANAHDTLTGIPDAEDVEEAQTEATVAPLRETVDKATSTPTAVPAPIVAPEINPLTGLRVSATKLNRRPLGVKIPNFPIDARPQAGLSRADVVIEHEAEAHLTRFTAIFWGNDVGLLGPVRSLRLVDAELMSIFKATLVASGGHPLVKIRITEGKAWAAGYKRVICPEAPFLGDGGAMRRVPKEGRRYELTLYSDTASLWNVSTQRGANQRPNFQDMWAFSEAPPRGGSGASHLKIVYKPGYSEVDYRYDAGSHTYKRFDLGQPTIDELTGAQISPPNVLLLFVNHVDSDILADTHDPDNPYYSVSIQLWGEGRGRLLRDGQVYDVKWVRQNAQESNDRLIVVDGQGNKVPFQPGPTWIQLVRLDGNMQID